MEKYNRVFVTRIIIMKKVTRLENYLRGVFLFSTLIIYGIFLTVTTQALTASEQASEYHWLETEHPLKMTSPMRSALDSSASSGKYIWVPNGAGTRGSAVYNFTISQAGNYVIWGRVIAPNGNDDSFFIDVDGTGDKMWNGITAGTAWVWDKVKDTTVTPVTDPVIFNLDAGIHQLKIKQREDGTKIDKVLITNDLDYAPTGIGEKGENHAHPNLFFNQLEIDDIKIKIQQNREPWLTSFAKIKSSEDRYTSPPDVYDGRDVNQYLEKMELKDSPHTNRNALLYALTGDARYGNRAKEFLMAWASGSLRQVNQIDDFDKIDGIVPLDVGLRLSRSFINFSNAYDLIYNTLSPQEHALVQNWLRKGHKLIKEGTIYWSQSANRCHAVSNHTTSHVAGLATIGFVLDDIALAKEAIEGTSMPKNWKTLVSESIYSDNDTVLGCDRLLGNPTFLGEVVDRYRHNDVPNADPWSNLNRGYGYSLVSASNLTETAEVAYHHGIDLYSHRAPKGESLLAPGIYYSHYEREFSPGSQLIQPKGYPGEKGYINELVRPGYHSLFEILSYRYKNHSEVARAFDGPADSERFYPSDKFFGKMFDNKEVAWNFYLDDIMEGWKVRQNGHIANVLVNNGILSFDAIKEDPGLEALDLSIKADSYPILTVHMKLDDGINAGDRVPAQVFWADKDGNFNDPDNRGGFNAIIDGTYRTYTLNLRNHSNWKDIISKFRFDPVNRGNVSVSIDSLILQKPDQDAVSSVNADLNKDRDTSFYTRILARIKAFF